MRQKILMAFFAIAFSGVAGLWAQGVAHEVRAADRLIGTPGGLVTITGSTVKLWSSADANGEVLGTLKLPAGARVVYRRGRALAVSYEPSFSPLAPGQLDSGYEERLRPLSVVQIMDHKLRLLGRTIELNSVEDTFTADGRGFVHFAVGADHMGVAIENLLTGQRTTVRMVFLKPSGKARVPQVEVTPQLVQPDRVLYPFNNALMLLAPDSRRLWTADEEKRLIGKIAVSDDQKLVLVTRLGLNGPMDAIEVRRVTDGKLVWSDGPTGKLFDALHRAGILADQEYHPKLGKQGRNSRYAALSDIETMANGWLLYGTGPRQAWVARVSCGEAGCAVNLLSAGVLKTEHAVFDDLGRGRRYALDMASCRVLHKNATGWHFVSKGESVGQGVN